MEQTPIRSHRLEDLGRIRELLAVILEDDSNPLNECISKHTADRFLNKYSDSVKLEGLHDNLRFTREQLEKIYYIAIGENYE